MSDPYRDKSKPWIATSRRNFKLRVEVSGLSEGMVPVSLLIVFFPSAWIESLKVDSEARRRRVGTQAFDLALLHFFFQRIKRGKSSEPRSY